METTYRIPTISCEVCAASIRAALERLPGVDILDVNVKDKQIRVRLDNEAHQAAVEQALTDVGYPTKGGGAANMAT